MRKWQSLDIYGYRRKNKIRRGKTYSLGDKLYLEKQSGKNANAHSELKKMMNFVREGDIIVVESAIQRIYFSSRTNSKRKARILSV